MWAVLVLSGMFMLHKMGLYRGAIYGGGGESGASMDIM